MASDTMNTVKKLEKKQKPKEKKPNFFKRAAKFFKDVSAELKRVTWPTKKDLISYTTAVIAFVILMGVIIGVLDLIFGYLMKLIISL